MSACCLAKTGSSMESGCTSIANQQQVARFCLNAQQNRTFQNCCRKPCKGQQSAGRGGVDRHGSRPTQHLDHEGRHLQGAERRGARDRYSPGRRDRRPRCRRDRPHGKRVAREAGAQLAPTYVTLGPAAGTSRSCLSAPSNSSTCTASKAAAPSTTSRRSGDTERGDGHGGSSHQPAPSVTPPRIDDLCGPRRSSARHAARLRDRAHRRSGGPASPARNFLRRTSTAEDRGTRHDLAVQRHPRRSAQSAVVTQQTRTVLLDDRTNHREDYR